MIGTVAVAPTPATVLVHLVGWCIYGAMLTCGIYMLLKYFDDRD